MEKHTRYVIKGVVISGFLPSLDHERFERPEFTDFVDSLRLCFDIISTMTCNDFFKFH